MVENKANDADLSAEKGQKDADKPQCKAAKKVWPWLVAVLLVAVVLLVVLLVVRNSRKGGEELSLAEAVALVNAKTPAVGATMVLDSVTFSSEENRVTYYNSILDGREGVQQLMRDYYCQLSDEDLRVLLWLDFEYDPLAQQVHAQKASVRFLFRDTDGRVLKDVTMDAEQLVLQPAEDKIRQAALVVIAQEARVTQLFSPQQLDEETAITGCRFDADSLVLEYTVALARAEKELDRADFEHNIAHQREDLVHALAHNQGYCLSGITMRYTYFDCDGRRLCTFEVAPKDYHEYHHGHHHHD